MGGRGCDLQECAAINAKLVIYLKAAAWYNIIRINVGVCGNEQTW